MGIGLTGARIHSAYFRANSDDETMGAAVHWKVDTVNQELLLAVAARATGWLGFGMAEVSLIIEGSKSKAARAHANFYLNRLVVCEEATWLSTRLPIPINYWMRTCWKN
jgi:hypothetical protein